MKKINVTSNNWLFGILSNQILEFVFVGLKCILILTLNLKNRNVLIHFIEMKFICIVEKLN